MSVQVPPEHYGDGYDSPARLASYSAQFACVIEHAPLGQSLLEVGIGNGTLTAVLRNRGYDVATVDFDAELHPDCVADVRELPLPDNTFNVALAFEVLEHLPWDQAPVALRELARIARIVIVSVPNVGPAFTLQAQIPNAVQLVRMALRRRAPLRDALWALAQRAAWRREGGSVERVATVPPLREHEHIFDGQHHWVLGEDGLDAYVFAVVAANCGLNVLREFRPAAHPSHHFFVLRR
jgi:SAM-dependent methyltransferase